jgi:hypothetical protein
MLIAATFVLIVAETTAVDAQSPKLSLLSTKVERLADYADSRANGSAARVKAYPDGHTETESAFDRMNDTADTRRSKRYRLSIVVRNDDAKTIRAVTFEYPLRYSQGQKPSAQVSFKSTKEIKPSGTVTLAHAFTANQYVFLFGQATVKSIEYTDGSVWRR